MAEPAPTRRVVVRLPNWLGDALMARPLLHALRRAQPRARIEAIGPPVVLSLLERERLWDVALAWPAAHRPEPGADVALVLPPSFSSAWWAWRWGARERIGFATGGRAPWLTRAWPRPERGASHLSREYLALGATLGVGDTALPALAPTAGEVDAAHALLERTGGVPERWLVIGPGAIYGPAKRWPADRYAAVAARAGGAGVHTLVCGGEADRGVAAEVARAAGASARSLAGETTLGVQLALCALATATVCNDSGLAHLAAATGSATVVVFGSTSSAWTAPLGARVRVVQHAPVCAPCFRRDCVIGYRCLEAVTVEEVARCLAA